LCCCWVLSCNLMEVKTPFCLQSLYQQLYLGVLKSFLHFGVILNGLVYWIFFHLLLLLTLRLFILFLLFIRYFCKVIRHQTWKLLHKFSKLRILPILHCCGFRVFLHFSQHHLELWVWKGGHQLWLCHNFFHKILIEPSIFVLHQRARHSFLNFINLECLSLCFSFDMSYVLNLNRLLLRLFFRWVAKKTRFHSAKRRRFLYRFNLRLLFSGLYHRVRLRLSQSDFFNMFLLVNPLHLSFLILLLFQHLCHVVQRWWHIIVIRRHLKFKVYN